MKPKGRVGLVVAGPGDIGDPLTNPEFDRRPLCGQRFVVTRSREPKEPLAGLLRAAGAEVLEVPTLRLAPPQNHEPLIEALAGLGAYDWLVFTSANGVDAFFEAFFKGFPDLRDLGGLRLAAVGPGTAARLAELHLQVEVMPQDHLAAKIADAMAKFESLDNLRILLARAETATPELPRLLEALGAIVDDVPCYRTVPETEDPTGAADQLRREGADWILFTSGSTVRFFHERFDLPKLGQQFPQLKLASIGPETSKALRALGLAPNREAKIHTLEGLVQSLIAAAKPGATKHPPADFRADNETAGGPGGVALNPENRVRGSGQTEA